LVRGVALGMKDSDKRLNRPFPAAAAGALAHGNKLEAIKIYLEERGSSLAEAKDAVERFMADPAQWEASTEADRAPLFDSRGTPEPGATVVSPSAEAALYQGKLIDAVRIVRTENRIGLKDAKDTVDRYVEDHPTMRMQLDRIRADARRVWLTRLLVVIGLVALAAAYLAWN